MAKKLLIITYYWPPSGGAGVQRWLKFAKYLPEFGWEPTIFTPENPESPAIDSSLNGDLQDNISVIKLPIWEPYTAYKRFIGQKQDQKVNAGFLSENEKPKLTEKASVWVRGNFFIPDARKFWIKPATKYLKNYLKENPVDAIISTGPPHSMHLIAMNLKKSFNIPWIADFRDPWTGIDFYDKLRLTTFADNKHKTLEKKVLQKADKVVAIGNVMAKDLGNISNRKVDVIRNGYDSDDFENKTHSLTKKFTITHVGSINADRNHSIFWDSLQTLLSKNPHFEESLEIHFVGKNDISVINDIKKYKLEKFIKLTSYLPHKEIFEILCSSQVLFLPINNTPNAEGILTGKIYEYLAAKRPILAIGPPSGELATVLKETKAGVISDFSDKSSLTKNIENYFEDYVKNNLLCESTDIERFSRKRLSANYADLLNDLQFTFSKNNPK